MNRPKYLSPRWLAVSFSVVLVATYFIQGLSLLVRWPLVTLGALGFLAGILPLAHHFPQFLRDHGGIVAGVLGTITGGTLVGLLFVVQRTGAAYQSLNEAEQIAVFWEALGFFSWSVMFGAGGLCGLAGFFVLTAPKPAEPRGDAEYLRPALEQLCGNIAVGAFLVLPFILCVAVVELVGWAGVEVWLPLNASS